MKGLELAKLEEVGKEIDRVVESCLPFANNELKTFSGTLALAQGVKTLREIFLNDPGVKATIEAMQDTKLGFLTDRSPRALARSDKVLKPYSYQEIAECCIEALLKGYRLTNNEFNVIASNFYEAKNGKYRKIVEHPDVTNFQFTNKSPLYASDFKTAKVQCFASWVQDDQIRNIGLSNEAKGQEDTLIFTVKVNAGMGDDAVVGKALSKLFTRVLMRVTGRVISEATDVEFSDASHDRVQALPESTLPPAEPGKVVYDLKKVPEIPELPKEEKPIEVGSNLPENKPQEIVDTATGEITTETETDSMDEDTKAFVDEFNNNIKGVLNESDLNKLLVHYRMLNRDIKDFPVDFRAAFLSQCGKRLDKQNAGK